MFCATALGLMAPCLGQAVDEPMAPQDVSVEASEEPIEPVTIAALNEAKVQPQPQLAPRPEVQSPSQTPSAASQAESAARAAQQTSQPPDRQVGQRVASNQATGLQAQLRAATDAGNLLGKSPSVLGVGIQHRSPIITDTRPRGDRVGALAASGSYWVPARIDLDTVLSKIDSRNVERMTVVKGPYSALYGPGFHFVDVELLRAQRFENGPEAHGATSFDYYVNGEQWHGRQSAWTGDRDWGVRVDYDHRTGNDYTTGAALSIPSSYNSRQVLLAIGRDFQDGSQFDFHYLRLDQTTVELPGQAFDIDWLGTDGFEATYRLEDQPWCRAFEMEGWHNRTRLTGSSQREGKRRQFPIFDFFEYELFTDTDSRSSGYFAAVTWGDEGCAQLEVGTDLRYIEQELNELASGRIGFRRFENANSPVPESGWLNPGLFAELSMPASECLTARLGGRLDWTQTEVLADPSELESLGNQQPQSSLAEILATDDFDQSFLMGLGYFTLEYELNECWQSRAGVGYGTRAPNLTELYAAQPFMFLLQNGLNIVTGDPRLDPERRLQADLGMAFESDIVRAHATAFYAWAFDYITFENMRTNADQVDLKYVNTDLATFAGFETYYERELRCWLTGFASAQYVQATDRDRNGDFATRPAVSGIPSERVEGLPRGSFSGVPGSDEEPLPGIPPLEGRAGLRLHESAPQPRWSVEVSARMLDAQNRVASSLRESPTAGFTVWDLRTHWQPVERLRLIGGVENFTDRNYREHLDFRSNDGVIAIYRPGINFYLGSEVDY